MSLLKENNFMQMKLHVGIKITLKFMSQTIKKYQTNYFNNLNIEVIDGNHDTANSMPFFIGLRLKPHKRTL